MFPGESAVIGNYDSTCDKFYMAMVKSGFRMSIENEITTEEKEDSTATGTISSEDKEMAHKKTPSKRSPKSKAKDGDNDD